MSSAKVFTRFPILTVAGHSSWMSSHPSSPRPSSLATNSQNTSHPFAKRQSARKLGHVFCWPNELGGAVHIPTRPPGPHTHAPKFEPGRRHSAPHAFLDDAVRPACGSFRLSPRHPPPSTLSYGAVGVDSYFSPRSTCESFP